LKLCVPLSDAFRERESDLLPLVDAVSFKSPSGDDYTGKRCFLESSVKIADPNLPDLLESDGTIAALKTGKYEVFSLDIGPMCEKHEIYSINGIPRAAPDSVPITEDEYLERARSNMRWLRRAFRGLVQIENNNYFPTGAYERICEPGFVKVLVDYLDVGLLLDLGHVEICVHYMNDWTTHSYIEGLPLGKVREIHLSHAGLLNGVFEDLHEVPTKDEFETTRLIPGCEFVTVEYYKDAEKLVNFYKDLAKWMTVRIQEN
jgi:hypothetical protein